MSSFVVLREVCYNILAENDNTAPISTPEAEADRKKIPG